MELEDYNLYFNVQKNMIDSQLCKDNIYNQNELIVKAVENEKLMMKECLKFGFSNMFKNCNYIDLINLCNLRYGNYVLDNLIPSGDYDIIDDDLSKAGTYNRFNVNENTMVVSTAGAKAGKIKILNKKVWINECIAIHPMKHINKQFIYYYLKYIQDDIYKIRDKNQFLYMSIFAGIKIPALSNEQQKEFLNTYYDVKNETKNRIRQLKDIIENNKKV
jgi:hypothetical protein